MYSVPSLSPAQGQIRAILPFVVGETSLPSAFPTNSPNPGLECPPEAFYGQNADAPENDSWGAAISDEGSIFEVYDNFPGVSGSVSGVNWWGFNLEYTDSWNTCDKDVEFTIYFYDDNDGTIGNLIATRIVHPTRTDTGITYSSDSGNYPLWHYQAALYPFVDVADGWILIKAHYDIGQLGCYFLWMSSGTGDGVSYQWNGVSLLTDLSRDRAFCFSGTIITPTPTLSPPPTSSPTPEGYHTPVITSTPTSSPTPDCCHVIITDQALEESFKTLRDHRIDGGMTSIVVTTEWIYDNYSGADTQEQIRNFIKDAYQNWNTEYVLLGGYSGIIPVKSIYASGGGEADYIPADLYYGCLDDGAEQDLTYEVSIGRAAVENENEVNNFIAKTIAYENSGDNYLRKASMIGEYLGFGGDSDYAMPSMEEIRLGTDAHGYNTVGFASNPWFDTSDPLYEAEVVWPKNDLVNLINDDLHIVNHLGHADYDYCMKLYNSDLSSLTNNNYFFGYSQGCMPGGFDTSDCWCEELTSMEYGAFAFIGNSRYGWGEEYSTDGPSQRFNRPFWDALFREEVRELGRMNSSSKEYNIYRIDDDCMRWCYYEINLFGDPAVMIKGEGLGPTPTPSPTPVGYLTPTTSPTLTPTPEGYWTPSPSPAPSVIPAPVFLEDYEAPEGWTQEYLIGAIDWFKAEGCGYTSGIPVAAHGDQYNALIYYDDYETMATRLISPRIDFGSRTNNATLTFWHTQGDWEGDHDTMAVYCRISDVAEWNLLTNFPDSIDEWTECSLPLPEPGADYWISFVGTTAYGWGVCIDDMLVTGDVPPPTPTPPPTALPTSSLTPTPRDTATPTPTLTSMPTMTPSPSATQITSPTPISIKCFPVAGKVVDKDSGVAISGASVRISCSDGRSAVGKADGSGEYELEICTHFADGTVRSQARYPGYLPGYVDASYIDWADEGVLDMGNIELKPESIYSGGIVSGDYDGDGISDIAIFRKSSGLWAIRGISRLYFGGEGDELVPADYNGDGTADISIFRASSGLWAIRSVSRIYYGSFEDIPVPGDYGGSGTAAIGIYRGSSGLWSIRSVTRAYFGGRYDQPAPGDYDGDGRDDLAIFRSSSGLWAVRGVSRVYFGSASDRLVPGDYDDSGFREIGIFRASTGLWAIKGVTRVYYGGSGDQPVPGDYSGRGVDEIGIFRPGSGLWAIRGVTRAYFGGGNDLPVTR